MVHQAGSFLAFSFSSLSCSEAFRNTSVFSKSGSISRASFMGFSRAFSYLKEMQTSTTTIFRSRPDEFLLGPWLCPLERDYSSLFSASNLALPHK